MSPVRSTHSTRCGDPIHTASDGAGRYVFPGDPTVITGTYNAAITNPSTGATAHASVQVLPRAGG